MQDLLPVRCKTNLDISPHESWPTALPSIPRVGECIQSFKRWDNKCQLKLRVVGVNWVYSRHDNIWLAEIELHDYMAGRSINDFHDAYKRMTGYRG